ncbi:MAG TPA: nitrous oxide-stimulated promoter family protein [Spirochaetia bacterium]|nr:nitrous oxide-stimulated promoter family protein [Spirochaetia bacterium]
MRSRSKALLREHKTVRAMIQLYCANLHGCRNTLCPECRALADHAAGRLDACRFGDGKPACSACPVHCYAPGMREAIRRVMRYSGPRMIVTHPIMAFHHLLKAGRAPS